MGAGQVTGMRGLSPGAAALAAALAVATTLAGAGGPAAAQAHRAVPRAGAVAGTIATVAGGVGGPAKATKLWLAACGVTFGGGSLYIGDFTSVRKVNPGTDWLTTPAGTGVEDPLGDGAPAIRAGISGGCGMALDSAGNLVIVDQSHERVRVVAARTGTFYGQAMTGGHIYTVAGNGSFGSSGDGGPATSARVGSPEGVAVDHAGNLVIAATGTNRVRVVAVKTGTFYGRAMTAGDIYTVAGDGSFGFSGDGGPATAAEFANPWDVAVDAAGNLVITDFNNGRIRVVAAKTGTFYGQAMTAHHIYTVAGGGTTGLGDGGPATSAELSAPQSVAVDGGGNLVLADLGHDRVRVVAAKTGTFYGQAMTAHHIYTVAGNGTPGPSGDGGPATAAGLAPWWAAVDGSGDLLIADLNSHEVRMVADRTGTFYGRPMTAGDIYTVAGGKNVILLTGLGGPATKAQIFGPNSVALDGAGNVLVTARNDVLLAAARTGTFYGRPVTAGNIYTVAGGGTALGDGGPATSARLGLPEDVSLDAAGNLLIADSGFDRIKVVAASTGIFYGQAMTAGDIYTVAGGGTTGLGDGGPATSAELSHPGGVTADHAGNLVIGDSFNERVRVVAVTTGTFYGQAMTAGDIYTVAGDGTQGFFGDGGPATSAELNAPAQLSVDGTGNIVIADTANQRIRVVAAGTGTFYGQAMTVGDIYTVAGGGTGGLGDGGPATSAQISFPSGVAIDGSGSLLIADSSFERIRVVPVTTGTFYGQAMTADHIYTVAGDGNRGFSGDGGPATGAEVDGPDGVVPDGTGGLLIADTGSGRVRMVAG